MTPRTHSPKNGASQYPAENYLNRELGILAFNSRVLAQAKNPATPLLERLRYICIVSSNLDEFFEIRVAGLKEQVKLHSIATTPDGLVAQTALEHLFSKRHGLFDGDVCIDHLAVFVQDRHTDRQEFEQRAQSRLIIFDASHIGKREDDTHHVLLVVDKR